MTARIAVLAVFILCAGGRANAQRAVAAPVSFGAELDSATAAQVLRIVNQVRDEGLPVEPVLAKARLGALRHASGETIVAASRAVADRLARAREALEPPARPLAVDIAAGADALGSGVTVDALRLVRAAAGERSVAVPLGVLAQLVVSGVSATRAAQIVANLVRRGAAPGQLVALGNDVDSDVRSGEPAVASLGVRLQQLEAILPAGGAVGGGAMTTTSGTPKKP